MTDHSIVAPKKLIEVALPLDAINAAAQHEKHIRHGHPSTMHLWWARRPLAAARAVLFAQLVNDPSWKYSEDELKRPQIKSAVTRKRNELFKLITQLVQWENTTNEDLLAQARKEIWVSWKETCDANKNHPDARTLFDPNKLPAFHDPFAGGGAIPLEAQRLGLDAHASDLNPVAVLINKAMIEIPSKFAGQPPVGPIRKRQKQTSAKAVEDWAGARGLAEDIRRYGTWMRDEAEKRIGHLYPKIEVSKQMAKERPDLKPLVGQQLTVIAWLWARTVRSPNPAFSDVEVPLVSSFVLASKVGKEAWVEPVVDGRGYRFEVRLGEPPKSATFGTTAGKRAGFRCLLSNSALSYEHIRAEGQAVGLGTRLMAVVAVGNRGRVYLSPTDAMQALAQSCTPTWRPDLPLPDNTRDFKTPNYGLNTFGDLFTVRQLVAITTLSDLVQAAAGVCRNHARAAGMADDDFGVQGNGDGAKAYAECVSIFLAFVLDKCVESLSTICTWSSAAKNELVVSTFRRQALPMTWDFAESNPFAESSGAVEKIAEAVARAVESLPAVGVATSTQSAAQSPTVGSVGSGGHVVSTDPPYYDNIGYADLSDFFYVWLRRTLKPILPELFTTLAVPKGEELVAAPYRHGGKEQADAFFLAGMTQAMRSISLQARPDFPSTIYYAFKQSETDSGEGTASAGWETFLQAILSAGLAITGTWPIRTEREARAIDIGANALASSIVLVARPRASGAAAIARKEFLRRLERALPTALAEMTADPEASVAPVDLAQAAIGPGMAIFSGHKAVLEADGSPMSVHNALIHINKTVDTYFAQAEGELDPDTRFCIGWFQQCGFEAGSFGEADVLARAKGTAVDGVVEAGVLSATKGKVRLLRINEYPKKWDPTTDSRVPVWEACHHMCRALGDSEKHAGELLARMPDKQDAIRQLAYRLYTICERQKWAEEARAYNELITSWPAIVEQSVKAGHRGKQLDLL